MLCFCPEQAAAYATNHTLEQLEQLHKEESSAYDTLQNKVRGAACL